MFSSFSSPRARVTLATSAAVLILAGCSSTTDTSNAAAVTESTIEEVLDQVTTTEATTTEDAGEETAQTATPTTSETTSSVEPIPDNDVTAATDTDETGSTDDAVSNETLAGVITDIVADASGGRSTFDGTVDEASDLDDLVVDAWGDGGLGLHRGHAQVENVLEAFLGIDHDAMHDYMDDGFNLADLSEELGKDPDALVETLTASYAPFVEEGVDNGVITEAEAVEWVELLRNEFTDRVYWDGVSTS